MFDSKIYIQRRNRLKKQIKSGLIVFLGNEESPMNYPDSPYHFRQDSSFLYFSGLDFPGLAAVLDIDENREIVFGKDIDLNRPEIRQNRLILHLSLARECSSRGVSRFGDVGRRSRNASCPHRLLQKCDSRRGLPVGRTSCLL